MSVRQRSFVGTIVLLLTLGSTACNKNEPQPQPQPIKDINSTAVPIMLTVGTDGYCLQNGVEGGNVVMGKAGVIWSGPASQNVQVTVNPGTHTCPFSQCSFPAGTSVPSGASSASPGDTFTYSSISVNGSSCNVGSGPGQDGLIMR